LRESDVLMVSDKGKKMHGHLFLFNDSIVITKKKRVGKELAYKMLQ
jgi:hypothetical protein